ncbi:hypothetical protein COCNU_scaffold001209G000010 [Cocos nucifera]|nr:hypothetical protein [Cocos nucifera]
MPGRRQYQILALPPPDHHCGSFDLHPIQNQNRPSAASLHGRQPTNLRPCDRRRIWACPQLDIRMPPPSARISVTPLDLGAPSSDPCASSRLFAACALAPAFHQPSPSVWSGRYLDASVGVEAASILRLSHQRRIKGPDLYHPLSGSWPSSPRAPPDNPWNLLRMPDRPPARRNPPPCAGLGLLSLGFGRRKGGPTGPQIISFILPWNLVPVLDVDLHASSSRDTNYRA